MNKLMKILTSSFIAVSVLTTAAVVPVEVAKNNNSSNLIVTSNTRSKQNSSNINQSKIITNKNLNINSILLFDIPENKIDNMMNNYFYF